MRFFNQPHAFYAGIDLHARSMFTHILDAQGATVFAKDLLANPHAVLDPVAPYRACLAVLLGLHVPRQKFLGRCV